MVILKHAVGEFKIVVDQDDEENGDLEPPEKKMSEVSVGQNNEMLLSDIDHSNFDRGKVRKKVTLVKFFS